MTRNVSGMSHTAVAVNPKSRFVEMKMASRAGDSGFYHRPILSISSQTYLNHRTCAHWFLVNCGRRWFSNTATPPNEFAGKNAYDVLGLSETCSSAEIKASFHKLAKETHPDLISSDRDPNASRRFVQILAAYEILSDSEKRAHYDRYLFSQKKVLQKILKKHSSMYRYESCVTVAKQMEVVEWLKWYRSAISEILSQEKVVVGSGYFDILEREFYSAIHAAYYGPVIESMDLLPGCFEAEERSDYGTPEVLHLVSGRDLFGVVYLLDKVPELSYAHSEKLDSFMSMLSGMSQTAQQATTTMRSGILDNSEVPQMHRKPYKDSASDVYKDLELHIYGRMVAVATRTPPKRCCNETEDRDSQDQIHVYLNLHGDPVSKGKEFSIDSSGGLIESTVLLGTISGLGTSPEEGSCFVYNSNATKTHVIMIHRTLLVKHMHWYQVGDEVSVCECRCSRARLPPSKFWLFEPRCSMHDIGGWYVETFGRDKRGRTVPSERYWDGYDAAEQPEKRLHPAMYLVALAYRTLDLEDARRRKRTVRDIIEPKLFSILRWCKKLI
ncbi:uncharacterized protein LOC122085080 [Macadamia integrifolia]|uniref:uncharacterized protein LOC122085080 n=1 Tax=Macadamia integrifolia TaxID=60698 RepID=UPI001C4F36BC|nr:uncharacterized protein LOC122085080 [Macadamia integrifolia]